MKKISIVLLVLIVILSALTFAVSAEGDYTMKEFDKAYITFVFDDNRMPFTQECYELFESYDMPVCFAVIASRVDNNPELISVLKDVEKSGGEVLSHTYNHKAFNEYSGVETFEYQLENSYVHLNALGFNVNGVIEAGSGGGEKKANYELMETVTRKYYKYSNAYGVSPQYKKTRTWFRWWQNKVNASKNAIDSAIKNKEWIVFSAHSFDEISKQDLAEVLSYIKNKTTSQVEVVTWNYIYNNFGEYTGPQVPTKEALAAVKKYKDELNPSSSSTQSGNQTSSNKNENVPKPSGDKVSTPTSNSSITSSSVAPNKNNNTTTSSAFETIGSTNASESTSDSSSALQTTNANKKKSGNMLWIALGIVAFTLIAGAAILIFALKYKAK